ncbi:erythromycin esterase family protein [Nonomuraea sp. K274]|uniref:Erythromycin esterase family protein n=1 Tax=Nonomuraea cypriaca TaxID=1187855 RepID=A0A931AAN8_9ACTN|nr:erythromycin esterase family protein [Nonomuraea cypriaca]MBF8189316.1 erythromycin esterase family protein [Nonomuraea cypriaca]
MAADPSIRNTAGVLGDEGAAAVTALLRSLPSRPRLLGLGEAMHGEESLPEARNEIFRQLVEHEGYRSIALESDCLSGLVTDAFVTTGEGTFEDAMRRGFSHGFGESEANRELVRWMRDYNRGRPAEDGLRFHGFDAPLEMAGPPSPRQALTALHDYLAGHPRGSGLVAADALDRLIGADDRWTNPAATMDPTQSVGRSEEARELRLIADDLVAMLLAESPGLIAATSRDDWWRARLYGRTAQGLLRYHAGMADTSPARMPWLMDLREAMMADNLAAIAECEERRGPTLVYAHNRHLQRDKSRWQLAEWALEWWSTGAIAGSWLGDDYAFLACAVGSAPAHGIGAPEPDTIEGVLSAHLPEGVHVIDSERLVADLTDAGAELTPRTGTWTNPHYFPLDPAHLADTDGVIFFRNIAP